MNPGSEIWNELNELSPMLAGLPKVNVFTVPEGYFDTIGISVLASLREAYPASFAQEETAFTGDVPEGYFSGLADSIMAKIKVAAEVSAADEIRELSPMLYSIQGENVYQVPAGYFDGLAEEISNRVQNTTPAKLVSFRKRTLTVMKYAVAAIFTGAMALSIFKFTGNGEGKLDDYVIEGKRIASENRIEEEMGKLTDADIMKYLESHGENIDVASASVTNLIDEKELPSQEDYLLDEKTLDNYLDNISAEDLKN